MSDLDSLRIDRRQKQRAPAARRAWRWLAAGLAAIAAGSGLLAMRLRDTPEVTVVRVRAPETTMGRSTVLSATGYIIAAHRIEVASKVVGRVAWIGVEKGDRVKAGQELVRLEDDEYRAQVDQARGQLANLEAQLAQLLHGSRPEEIAVARANLDEVKAEAGNARVTLERTRKLVAEGVMAKQTLDDALARYDGQAARAASLQKTLDLAVLGPRQEQIDAVRGQIVQARGALAYAETGRSNTVIRAPVSGTILERVVEKGEFLTTSFVGDRGAKSYVVALADLNDLQVELDISQNDFARLRPNQKGVVTTDAFPDRRYEGAIAEISPEANRQKATVQVKVKIANPDDYLRPEMNASVAFYSEDKPAGDAPGGVVIPEAALRGHSVFVIAGGRAVERTVAVAGRGPDGVRIASGLAGGEDVILNPPPVMKAGQKVRTKKGNS